MKKVLGYLFICLGVVLTFALLGQLSAFLDSVFKLFSLFSNNTGYDKGVALGTFFYWGIHISLIIVFFSFGSKWIKTKSKQSA